MSKALPKQRLLLGIESLTRTYPSGAGVFDVSFACGNGIVGLLGQNGAGKTTLLRSIATLDLSYTGRVRYPGVPTNATLKDVRRTIGFVPQEAYVHPQMRVERFLDYVALLKEIDSRAHRRSECQRVLELTHLVDRRRDRVRELSGGMRQRLAVAQALLGKPSLLLLDEPSVGLDPEQRVALREALLEIAEDTVVVVSSHQIDELAHICSEVVVMRDGRVVFSGDVASLFGRARGRVWLSTHPSDTALFSSRTADGRFRNVGQPPKGARVSAPSLEDAYLLVTRSAD